jgi:ribosome maturation factor RimP
MLNRAKLDEIVAVANGVLHPAGYDCIEAEWSAHDRILRLFVDKLGHVSSGPEDKDGINLDGCVEASRMLLDLAAIDDLIPGKYTMEVSSPGVDRPLRRLADFTRHVGDEIDVRLVEKVENRRNGKGRLTQLEPLGDDDARLTLETAEGRWSFPLASLQRASLVYDWKDE